jgi:hypothetical protein
MRAIEMVFVQPRIHALPQFAAVQRLIMIVKAFPLERTDELFHEGLFLGGFGSGLVLGNASGGKICLHVLSLRTTPTFSPTQEKNRLMLDTFNRKRDNKLCS